MHEGRNQLTIHLLLACCVPYCSKYNTSAKRNFQKSFISSNSFSFHFFHDLDEKPLPRQAQSPQPSTYIGGCSLNPWLQIKFLPFQKLNIIHFSHTMIWLVLWFPYQVSHNCSRFLLVFKFSPSENMSILLNICEE